MLLVEPECVNVWFMVRADKTTPFLYSVQESATSQTGGRKSVMGVCFRGFLGIMSVFSITEVKLSQCGFLTNALTHYYIRKLSRLSSKSEKLAWFVFM